MNIPQAVLIGVVLAPGVVFAALALLWLLGCTPGEKFLTRLSSAIYLGGTAGIAVLSWALLVSKKAPMKIVLPLGNWYAVGHDHFPLVLMVDRLSLPFLALSVVLSGLIGHFSATYLHREPGFLRFYLLLHLFAFGSFLAFAAGSFDLLAVGWEIVGITSVLLIGFFQQRPAPVENGLHVFGIYRVCDIGLLAAIFFLHHWAGSTSLSRDFSQLHGMPVFVICFLLLFAASGKAAQVPFSGWLPRAMEGPTPSSAVFYGAISIHLGAYLLLRAEPLLALSPLASAGVILIGGLTALHCTLAGRVSADAKTSLAYATLTQVGLIFIEIGLGWQWLAIVHMLGNAIFRTLQYLRAPSLLHDYHQMYAASGCEKHDDVVPPRTGTPGQFQLLLYRWAFDRGHLDTILDRGVIAPLLRVSRYLMNLDHRESSGSRVQPHLTLPFASGPLVEENPE